MREDTSEEHRDISLFFPAETMVQWCRLPTATAFLRFLGSTVSHAAGNAPLTLFVRDAATARFMAAASTQAGPLPANLLEDWLQQHPQECAALTSGECVTITAATMPAGVLAPVMNAQRLEGAFYLETVPPQAIIQHLCWLLGQAGAVIASLRVEGERSETYAEALHAIRTPLMSVRGYTKMLFEGQVGALSAQQKEFLMIVLENAERMVRSIRNAREPEAIS